MLLVKPLDLVFQTVLECVPVDGNAYTHTHTHTHAHAHTHTYMWIDIYIYVYIYIYMHTSIPRLVLCGTGADAATELRRAVVCFFGDGELLSCVHV